eukprot:653157-Pelagomonas_calceolata.AAC.1
MGTRLWYACQALWAQRLLGRVAPFWEGTYLPPRLLKPLSFGTIGFVPLPPHAPMFFKLAHLLA